MANDLEKHDEEANLELATPWVRLRVLILATSMKFLLTLTVGVCAFAAQTYLTPKPSTSIASRRRSDHSCDRYRKA